MCFAEGLESRWAQEIKPSGFHVVERERGDVDSRDQTARSTLRRHEQHAHCGSVLLQIFEFPSQIRAGAVIHASFFGLLT